MKQIAKVEIISANSLDVFKWLRKEMNMDIKSAKELSNSTMIDFHGDYKKAIDFFNYLDSFLRSSARLIIDFAYDRSGIVGAFFINEETLKEDEKFREEYDTLNDNGY